MEDLKTWLCQLHYWRPRLEDLVKVCPDAASEFQHDKSLDFSPLPLVYYAFQRRMSLESILEEATTIAVSA